MKNEKLEQDPAFPVTEYSDNHGGASANGMSKRFYAACAAMQGLLPSTVRLSLDGTLENDYAERNKSVVEAAYRLADEIIRQENQ